MLGGMYSEHIVATLSRLARDHFATGRDLDAQLGRVVVPVGRVLGPKVGARPSDLGLTWWATRKGEPCPVGTRGAVHVLGDSRTGLGLGAGRGVIESAGDRLAVVTTPEAGRYVGAYRLPGVQYGGLL